MRTTLFLSLIAVCPAFAGEYAVLQNGFRIKADRHEVIGEVTRLHTATGTMDLRTEAIAKFEVEEYVPPAPAEEPIAPAEPANAADAAPPTHEELLTQAAERHGLLPEFVRSVASAESAMRQDAISPKGAIGLMQLMPGTARELGADPHDPAQNADAGTRYLRQLLDKYKHTPDPVRYALAAYNAGPGAVDKYGTVPPYRETQTYVERVLRKYLAELKARRTS